ncbi:50S ribosomal protein L10 [Bacteroidia bacterium]|nr:50S ribosomal protein L10 [Bacteroidia bacterium]
MNKAKKTEVLEQIKAYLATTPHLYVTDVTGLNAEQTSKLRRLCFKKGVKLVVVKNTLLKIALTSTGTDYSELNPALKGTSAILLSEVNNEPAKLIKEFNVVSDKFKLKGAYVEECFYIGEHHLEALISIKSKSELIGEIVSLLQSPIQQVIGALSSGGQTIAGVLKTLEEKAA